MMMGTIDGINLLNRIKIKPFSPNRPNKVVISSLEVLDKQGEIKQYYCADDVAKGVKLSYKSSYLSVSFFNTDFRHSDKNVFFYKLEGLNDNWISLGEKNYIRFASLTPGIYVLHVKGISLGNAQEAKEATLHIEVQEVFYKKIWFIVLVGLFVLLLISWAVYIKVQRIKEVLLVRAKISSDLHDNVGSVLTRVAMQAELLQDEVNAQQSEVLQRIIKTCRMAMSNMRDVIWSTDVRYNSIGNLFDKITEMVQQTMEQSPIVYKLNFDEEVKKLKITQEQKQEVFFIIKEAFHNILKHANGNVAELNVFKVKNHLVFTLYNDGEVIKKQLQTSSGLNNMYMRASRIKANFSIDVTDGFLIKLIIPIKKRLFIV
ncbi:MAG: hypothetical protein EAY81_00025 [Bacteroidetes bacterium]|nr:MAG: hypothetical protein EAY81_00025 [Bacteroidota bacterium]